MAGVVGLKELVQAVSGWVRTAQAELVRDHLSAMIHQKSIEIDLAYYESPEYHDQLERARTELSSRPLALLESLGGLLQASISLLAMAMLLIPYGAWLPFALFLSTVPAFYVVVHFSRRYHSWWEQTTADRRRAQYYDMMLTHSTMAAELRLFGLGPHFKSVYQDLRQQLRAERVQLTKSQSFARLGASITSIVISGATLAWMFWRAVQGSATLGDLALFYQAFHHGQGLVRSLLEGIGQIYSNTLFLGSLFEFLQLPSQVRSRKSPRPEQLAIGEGIRFHQVAFRYPNCEEWVLQDFNLIVRPGELVAIVGANGAGKSTLLKLLCRFYDPEAGHITLGGRDIRDLPTDELRRMMTVIFQWPVPYQASAAQNIAFGDISRRNETTDLEFAARSAGAHEVITKLAQGYDTLLGKWFANGVELSVGEWQRLALARAFFRRAQVLILDEPTSALDSWAEADWIERVRSLVAGRTTIIITHRFTIARRTDMIHVMDHGRIVESGTHDHLLTLGGHYAKSWLVQVEGQPLPAEQAFVSNVGVQLKGGGDGRTVNSPLKEM
jgi:ATP-binding cassette subfamily B protein